MNGHCFRGCPSGDFASALTQGIVAVAVNSILNSIIRREDGKDRELKRGFECISSVEVNMVAQESALIKVSSR